MKAYFAQGRSQRLGVKGDTAARAFEGYKVQTGLKDMFAKGAKTNRITTQEAPAVTEQAPKIANNSSEEVVVGPKEMHFWRDLEKELIIATILQSFTNTRIMQHLRG